MFKGIENSVKFPEMEKKWLDCWDKNKIVEKYRHKNDKSDKIFSFQDGPITANNPMGVHHAWGRTYKDLFQKFFNLLGFRQRFQNGFDCQGLWVEVEVEKELGLKSKKDIENLIVGSPTSSRSAGLRGVNKKASIAKFIDLCKERVYRFSKIQTEQSKRLGYFMDWEHSYYTMNDDNNYMIWHFLKKCYENGWIYKGRESVPWCPRCETAISQHEMLTEDYKELTHESVFFRLPIINKGWENTYLLVWTTTPWTIPANVAVGINTSYKYGLWKDLKTGEKYIFLHLGGERKPPTRINQKNKAELSLEQWIMDKSGRILEHTKDIEIKELLNLNYKAPFDDLEIVKKAKNEKPKTFHSVINASSVVTDTEGTGLLHIAPGAGEEDFKLGKKENLPLISIIGDNADYLSGMGEFSGRNAKKQPEIIIDYLKKCENGRFLFKTLMYTHRYPACWRCKTELVWKVADEWYIAMDLRPLKIQNPKSKIQNKTLRGRMIDVAKKIKWMPEFGLERELDWLKNMHDWLISKKNRYWGLALPIYECKKCSNFEVIGSKEELKARSIKGWDNFENHTPHKPFIDEVIIKCSKCGHEVKRIDDVGNPWLDAGIVPFSTIKANNQGEPLYLKDPLQWRQWFPIDFITESFPGQFKNWFYSMIAMSTVLEDTNPFKAVLGYATLTAEDGKPMHKSWGNMIEFYEGAEKIGVDVMRWMYARQNPVENLMFGYKRADEVRRQFYLLLWNVYKFFVEYANLDKPNIKYQISNIKNIHSINSGSRVYRGTKQISNILDSWIVSRFIWLTNFVKNSLSHYNPKDATLEMEKFVNDLSTWYIRRSRDRVWVNCEDNSDKMLFYETLHYILVNLAIILSPILPFITEEIYTNLTNHSSVHLADWPKIEQYKVDNSLINDMSLIRAIVEVGHRVRKELKIKVRQPLSQATVVLPKKYQFQKEINISEYNKLICSELNIKKCCLQYQTSEAIKLTYDTKLTSELLVEGKLRDLIRVIQGERKKLGVKQNQGIVLTIPQEFVMFKEQIQKKVLAKKINQGSKLKVSI